MSDQGNSNGKPHRIENRITLGNLITIGAIIGAGLIGWGSTQTNIAALAQRVDQGEKRDDKTADTLKTLEGSVIRIETEQQAVRREAERLGRQLDRIEHLIRNGAPPSQPSQPTFRTP